MKKFFDMYLARIAAEYADVALEDMQDLLVAREGTLAEVTFHTDWMRYDCYVDLSGAVLGFLTEPMPVPELDGFTPAVFHSCCA